MDTASFNMNLTINQTCPLTNTIKSIHVNFHLFQLVAYSLVFKIFHNTLGQYRLKVYQTNYFSVARYDWKLRSHGRAQWSGMCCMLQNQIVKNSFIISIWSFISLFYAWKFTWSGKIYLSLAVVLVSSVPTQLIRI